MLLEIGKTARIEGTTFEMNVNSCVVLKDIDSHADFSIVIASYELDAVIEALQEAKKLLEDMRQ